MLTKQQQIEALTSEVDKLKREKEGLRETLDREFAPIEELESEIDVMLDEFEFEVAKALKVVRARIGHRLKKRT